MNNVANGFKIRLTVYDPLGYRVGGYNGLGNEEGLTCTLDKGITYSILVEYYSDEGAYTLLIGQQKENVDVTNRDIIHDSIEYEDQCNRYAFIPKRDGTYRFDFSDVVNDVRFRFDIYDSQQYRLEGYDGIRNGDGVTAQMEAGEQYMIEISQYNNYGAYTLGIGRQQKRKIFQREVQFLEVLSMKIKIIYIHLHH